METIEMATTMPFDYRTHNGEITIRNRETGGHRTLRIKTQKDDAKFAPGERILSLMTGQDNENDYTGFAFVKSDGRICIWGSKKTPLIEKLADMVARPDAYSHKCDYMYASRCRKCNRKLTNPTSIETGIGPECAGRVS